MIKFILSILKNTFNIFWKLFSYKLKKNIEFKNKHKGETCIIIANGSSLKYFDISKLPNITKIGCTYSLIDNRLKENTLNYCIFSDSYLLYPYRQHSYKNSIQRNFIEPILKKLVNNNSNTIFFTSLTNCLAFLQTPKNVRFFHHFGNKNNDLFDLTKIFNMSNGALSIMIGVAKYMGFKKAILIGCDYLGSPKYEGHFYAKDIPKIGKDDLFYSTQIKNVSKNIEIICLFRKGVKAIDFDFSSFEDFYNTPEYYKENFEIIDKDYLQMMKRLYKYEQSTYI